jgi:hypothetical protein
MSSVSPSKKRVDSGLSRSHGDNIDGLPQISDLSALFVLVLCPAAWSNYAASTTYCPMPCVEKQESLY